MGRVKEKINSWKNEIRIKNSRNEKNHVRGKKEKGRIRIVEHSLWKIRAHDKWPKHKHH